MRLENLRSRINQEQLRIALAGWPALIIYVVIYAATYIYLDLFHFEDDRTHLLWGFVIWGTGYLLTLNLMNRSGYFDKGKRSGLGTYFVLGIVILLGVLFGLVLLIIPGIYLFLRWLPAYADALGVGGGAGPALRRSWQMTEGAWLPLAVATIYPGILFFIGLGVSAAAIFEPSLLTTGAIVTYNVALGVSVAWFTILGIASFGVLSENRTLEVGPS